MTSSVLRLCACGSILFFSSFSAQAQHSRLPTTPPTNPFAAVDKLALQLPDSAAHSTRGIARYITATFTSDTDKARAIYIWLARNIRYDVEKASQITLRHDSEENILRETLATRMGVCQQYADLFTDIAIRVGLPAYTVSGFTKQADYVDYIPHAWCAAQLNGSWYLFDPTWGAGYTHAGRFVQRTNNAYFKVKAAQFITNHMPFDPLWQLQAYPITARQFSIGKISNLERKVPFSFADSIQLYQRQDTLVRLQAVTRRIQQNGIQDPVVYNKLVSIRQQMENYRVHQHNAAIHSYNEVVHLYNGSIFSFNKFIEYRNAQFLPKKTDEELTGMIYAEVQKIKLVQEKMAGLPAEGVGPAERGQLQQQIQEIADKILEQQAFVAKYCATGKLLRRTLFASYMWYGRPLN
ncbi:transglutaminase domain-containing protein [Hymenobacter profundi]|uniref:Transglutaminase-like domain-containing protein n=1 Tax=Hymenobacter profundi TaxID=1982110 RepID=A0ABS6X4M1_9BACT|nr:transglutaminase domain-containing protein [Hymenobacter profundi]MBW3130788.1 hypothetical protein [Hymenobacter profundi]